MKEWRIWRKKKKGKAWGLWGIEGPLFWLRTFETPGGSRHVCRMGPENKLTRVEILTPTPSLCLCSVGIGFHCLNQEWTMAEPDESFFQIHTCLFASLKEATFPPHPHPCSPAHIVNRFWILDTWFLQYVWRTGGGWSHQRASSQLTVMLGSATIGDTPRESFLVLGWHLLCYHCLRFPVHVVQGLTKNRCLINDGSQHPSYWPFCWGYEKAISDRCRMGYWLLQALGLQRKYIWDDMAEAAGIFSLSHPNNSNWRFS